MKLGLDEEDILIIKKAFARFPTIELAVLFGSRAMGHFRKGSDVDIALKGSVDQSTLDQLKVFLNQETLLPYMFDIVIYKGIESKDFKNHIDQYGKIIYKKET